MKTLIIKTLLLLAVFVILVTVLTGVAYKFVSERIEELTVKEWTVNGDLLNYEVGCEKKVKKLPLDEVLLNAILSALEIRLHHGEGQSYVSFFGSNVQNFTTPDVIIDHPLVPFAELEEHINDINSDDISIDIIKGERAVEIKITFEEDGYEIKGDDWNDVDVNLNDIEVSFKLGLTVVEPGVLGYDEATADFNIGSVDVGGLRGVILNIFRDQIKDYIEDAVTSEMQKTLDTPETRQAISDALMSPLRALWIQEIINVEYNVDSITIYAW
jgi:hypothetical protein